MKNLVLSVLMILLAGCTFTASQDQEIVYKNYLVNGGFENAKAGWTTSGTGESFTVQNTTVAKGKWAASFDSSATSQWLLSKTMAVPEELKGNACMVQATYKTTAASQYLLSWHDCSGTVYDSLALPATTDWVTRRVGFTCPTTGNLCLYVSSTQDSAPIYLDDMFIGKNVTAQISAGDGLGFTNPNVYSVNVDDSTIEISGDAVQVKDDGVTGAKLNSNVVDDSTLQQTGTTLNVKDLGISTGKIQDNAITYEKLEALNYQISSAVASFTTTNTSYQPTGLSVTIDTTGSGRPIFVGVIPDITAAASGDECNISCQAPTQSSNSCEFAFFDGSTNIAINGVNYFFNGSTYAGSNEGCDMYTIHHNASAGSHTYTFRIRRADSGSTAGVYNIRLIAYEL